MVRTRHAASAAASRASFAAARAAASAARHCSVSRSISCSWSLEATKKDCSDLVGPDQTSAEVM